MDAEIKQKWVEALRSDKYTQAKSCLRTADGYCCLGVLCDIIAPDGWLGDEDYFIHRGGAHSFPDREIIEVAGIEGDIDSTEVEHPLWQAAHMNDSGMSFTEIADYIEEHL